MELGYDRVRLEKMVGGCGVELEKLVEEKSEMVLLARFQKR